MSELNALGFPALGVCTSLFPLPGLFYFSCEHLLLIYPFLLPTFCRGQPRFFHAKSNNPISSRTLFQDYFLRSCTSRAGWETANVKPLSSNGIVYAIQHMYFARERTITEPLKKDSSLTIYCAYISDLYIYIYYSE